jgi:hypothetical protein
MRPTKLQIEEGINSTGKYKENIYSLREHQAYVDGWFDAIDFCHPEQVSDEPIQLNAKTKDEIDTNN